MSSPSSPKFSLYHYPSCFYCGRVRKTLSSLGLEAELRNIHGNDGWVDDLIALDGRRTVPVLRIETSDGEVQWMRESGDIVRYLQSLAS